MNIPANLTALRRSLIAILLALLLAPSSVRAQATPNPPGQISYQGFLVDGNGTALATNTPKNYDVIFRIYTQPSGGTNRWAELQTVTVDRGYFSVMLGQGSSVDSTFTNNLASVFAGNDASDRYIGLTVRGLAGGDVEIQPRLRLLASPYSFLAASANNAAKLGGYDWSTVFPDTGRPDNGTIPGARIAANSITSSHIVDGTITSSDLGSGSVISAKIASGAVGSAQIASSAVGSAQIAGGAVTAAQIANGAVGALQMANGSVTSAKLATLSSLSLSGSGIPAQFTISSGGGAVFANNTSSGTAVWLASDTYAAWMNGDLHVGGSIFAGGKDFKIDHPLDAANKYLYHASVESADMKNIYDGVITLDSNGEATISLPAWFQALNKDFRYQLTAIGSPGPKLYVAEEVSQNHFKIAGGTQGLKVSWQITGVRQDAFANAHRMQVEEQKPSELRGFYLHPEEHGQPRTKSEHVALHPEIAPAR